MTAVLDSDTMARTPATGDSVPPTDSPRVPVRLTHAERDALREHCLIRLRQPIEVVAGRWVAERLAAELAKPADAKPGKGKR